MGQIIGGSAKPKRCNLNKLSQLGIPAAGEYILVSSDNSMNADGQGNFDCYIVGNGRDAATELPLIKTYANDVDNEPTAGSDNLVKSGGVAGRIADMDRKFSVISFVGKGSTFSKSSTYCGVVAGRTYRIVMLDMSFAESEYSGIIQGIYYTDNNDAEKAIIEYTIQWVSQVFYITIPDDFKAGSSLIFGGRADAGVEVTAYVYDITDVLAESDRAKAAEQALDTANKRGDLFLVGDNVDELVGYVSHSNGPHKVYNANSHYYLIPVKAGDKITVSANSYYWCIFASRTVNGNNETYTYATGYSADKTNKPSEVVVPSDGVWFYVAKDYNSSSYGVTEILVNGIDVLGGGIVSQVADVSAWIDENSGVVAKSINDVEIHDGNLNGVKQWLGYIKDNTKAWVYNTQYYTYLIPVKKGDVVNVRDTSGHVYIVVLSSVSYTANGIISSVTYATGYASQTKVVSGVTVTIPADGHYFYIQGNVSDGVDNIIHFDINGFDILKGGALSQVEALQGKMDIIYPLIPSDGSIVALNGGETHMKLIMDNLVRKQGTPSSFTGNRPFVLLYFSDIHGKLNGSTEIKDELAISRIVAFKNKYSAYLSDTLHGGDGVYTSMAGESTLDYDGAEDILNTIGNHDVLLSGGTFADAQAAYNKFLAGKIENWGVEYTENLCYYYKDYSTSKLRLIVLDCMHWDSAQNTWLAATLADAAENVLSVVICDHYVPNANFTILREKCTFSTLDPDNIASGGSLNAQASATVQAAIDDATHPLDFVCWLFGHTHRDYFGYLTDYPNQYGICIAKASGDYSGWEQDSVRTKGTKAYDCLNLISVDTTAKMLSITRIGNNTDRFMRQKNYLAFDYANHKIMGNS